MTEDELHVVTGAFGYSGKYIARRLLDRGIRVRTLTNSPHRRNPFGNAIEVRGYNFDRPEELVQSLRGASVLYNTHWVRFNWKTFSHADAVRNTQTLFRAAREAGVERVVHVSITNPAEDSPLEYFRGKAVLERSLRESGLSHAILRPAVLFGGEDILINNIAWMLRRFPVFGVFGGGRYRLQPIHVEDFADLAFEQGQKRGDAVVNAIGQETFAFRELAERIGEIIGHRRPIVSIPPWFGYRFAKLVGLFVGDVVLTREEIEGLMADLLYVDGPPSGTTKLTDWARANADTLGRRYASELARRQDRERAYS